MNQGECDPILEFKNKNMALLLSLLLLRRKYQHDRWGLFLRSTEKNYNKYRNASICTIECAKWCCESLNNFLDEEDVKEPNKAKIQSYGTWLTKLKQQLLDTKSEYDGYREYADNDFRKRYNHKLPGSIDAEKAVKAKNPNIIRHIYGMDHPFVLDIYEQIEELSTISQQLNVISVSCEIDHTIPKSTGRLKRNRNCNEEFKSIQNVIQTEDSISIEIPVANENNDQGIPKAQRMAIILAICALLIILIVGIAAAIIMIKVRLDKR